MGTLHEVLTPELCRFISQAPMFFLATAPLSQQCHVNLSPKGGMDTFAVLDDRTIAYLDLIGSGAESIAHVQENGRITIMLCSFARRPKILRLYGQGRCVYPDSPEWPELNRHFGTHPIPRSIVVVSLSRIADSCGFTVPEMTFVAERDLQDQWGARKSPVQLEEYMVQKNSQSIDGLPARPPPPPSGAT